MGTTPPFGAAVFDMDGLLLDTERPILDAWLQASREHGCPIEAEAYLNVVGRSGPDGRMHFRRSLGEQFPFDAVRARVQALIAEFRQRDGHALKPGVTALLSRLKAQGVPLAVASSTRREEVERRLASQALLVYFDAVAAGDEVPHAKPSPDVYLLAAQRLGVEASTCLAFEDSPHGAQAALAAGMAVVVVPDLVPVTEALRGDCLVVLASLLDTEAHHARWFGPN